MKRPGDNSNQRAIGIKPIAASHRPRWPALNHPSVAVRQDISHLIPVNPTIKKFPQLTLALRPKFRSNLFSRNKCQPVPAGAAGVYPSSIVLILVLVPIALTQLVVIQSRLHPVAPSCTESNRGGETSNNQHRTSNIQQGDRRFAPEYGAAQQHRPTGEW
jgi:hypothetical protein